MQKQTQPMYSCFYKHYKAAAMRSLFSFLMLSILVFSGSSLLAQTTYIGPNNGLWETAANWNNGLPGPGNKATIPGGGNNVRITAPLTVDFDIDNFSSITAEADVTNQGNFGNLGTFTVQTGLAFVNESTFNNFATADFQGNATFDNITGATFINGGTFTLPTTLTNSGDVTNNGTINAQQGLVQTSGTFSNNQVMTVTDLTVSSSSSFVNNFGANLNVTGTGASFDADGNITNNGTITCDGVATVRGTFANNVVFNVSNGASLTVTAAAQMTNGGTILNQGTFTINGQLVNNNNVYNEGTATNNGTFNQNNRVENRTGATFTNGAAATWAQGFGSVLLNDGTFNQNNEFSSVGSLTNNNIFVNNGNYLNNSGGTITNNGDLTNNGTLTSFFTITNNDVLMNNGQLIVSSGCVLTNNADFTNNTSGVLLNEFEIVNTTGATFTNKGNLNSVVRFFVNGGTVTNQAFFKNQGDLFTKTGGTLRNEGFFLQAAGNIKNEGTLRNLSEFISDDCSSINNTGTINNTGGNLKLQAILIQRGTLTGAAIDNAGGYIHTATTSNAPAVCANETITADADGVVKAYATGLVAFANFDSCQNIIYTANGIARPTFTCNEIGTVQNVNIKLVTRLGDSLTCISQVTPTDFLAPEFSLCPTDISVSTSGNAATAEWTTPVVGDNCDASVDLTSTHNSGASFPIGITAVTYTAVDDLGNEQQCQFKINVVKISGTSNCTGDNTPPVLANCPTDFVVSTNNPVIPVTWAAPTATDACQPVSLSSNFAPGRTFPLGRDTVVYTATDGNGNSSTCSFIVNVFQNDLCLTDNQDPAISNCPGNIYMPLNATLNGALAIWDEPNVSDNCAISSVSASQSSASVFPAGATTVTYTAADASNNTASCTFVVTVGTDPCPGDNSAPSISNCPSDIVRNINSGTQATATWTAPTANDPCSPVNLSSNFQSGAAFNLGITQVVYTASDAKGNVATCDFTITVQTSCSNDTEVPTISGCPTEDVMVATTASSAAAAWNVPTATDNCGIASFGASYTSGATFPVGVTSIVYTAFDTRGNSSSCAFNINVVNAPSCVTNAQPINNATSVAEDNLTLLWNADDAATAYDVYLGLTASTTELIAPNVTGTSITVNDLNGGTQYFWRVVPKNGAGAASGCTTTSFTTGGTPQTGGGTGGTYSIDNSLPICKGEQGTGLTRQVWNNIPNSTLSSLLNNAAYPNSPSSTSIHAGSTYPWNTADNYGSRIRGFITPSVSGNYQLVITGDDQTRLNFAQNENPSNAAEIARIDSWTGQTQFDKFASQTSASIFMAAGQSYYIELLHKEGTGGDGWGIYWKTPGNTNTVAIPLSMLSPITNDCGSQRVTDDLLALYDFKEGSGATVRDVSGVGTAMDLTIKHTGRVTRLSGGCGLRINSGTIIQRNGSSSKISNAVSASNEITIEAWVKASNITQSGPARIVTHSQNTTNRNFTLGQEANQWAVRLRTPSTSNNGTPEILVNGANTNLRHIVYTRNAAGLERFYVDNELFSTTNNTGNLSFDNSYTFALGNEISEDRPWLGEYHLVAVYSKALTEAEIGQNYHKGVCSDTDINVCDGNMAANGTFEDDFFGWSNNGGTITNTAASGSQAVQICGNGNVVSEAAIASAGKEYTLTAQARISGAPSYAVVSLYFEDINGNQLGGFNDVVVNTSSYQEYSETRTAPANTAWVRIEGYKQGTSGCLLIDDMCLTDGTTFSSGGSNGGGNGGGDCGPTDTEDPTFSACPSTVTRTTTGTTATATWTAPTANDNCGFPLVASNFESGDVFPLGTTQVRYTAFDTRANTGVCNFNVTVNNACANDSQAPVISGCPSNITQSTNEVTRTATWAAPTANDNCGTVTLTSNKVPGDFFPPGVTQVVYTAVDAKGNSATCAFNVTINSTNECANDTEAPEIQGCPADIVATTTGNSKQVNWNNLTVTDNCTLQSFTANFIPGLIFPLGVTDVRYTAIDVAGNVELCEFTVTINQDVDPCSTDTEAPTLTACPSNIALQTTASTATAIWTAPTANDNCDNTPLITSTHDSGDAFPVGVTNVIYTATDASNNASTCGFTVTVTMDDPCANDTEAPILTACPADIALQTMTSTATAIWTAPTANDNCDNAPVITATHASGDAFPVGVTNVIYTATDASNNASTCGFAVTVTMDDPCATDTEAPVLSACPSNISENTSGTTATATWTAPTATDNCDTAPVTSTHNSGDAFPIGTTTVTYTATDASGNTSTCAFDVTVTAAGPDCNAITFDGANSAIRIENLNAPVVLIQVFDSQWATAFSCAGNCNTPTQIINNLAAGNYFVKVDLLTASWTPICKREEFVTVTTGGGGTGVLTFPEPADITVDAAAGQNAAIVNYDTPTATSTCTTGSVTVLRTSGPASGSSFVVGTTEVCYTATDGCGNQIERCFDVTVNGAGAGDCDNVTMSPGSNSITIGGLTSPLAIVQVFNANWTRVYNCAGNCNSPSQIVPNLPNGVYYVAVDLLTASWQGICRKEQFVSVTGGNTSVITLNQPADITVTVAQGETSGIVNYSDPTGATTCAGNNLVITRTSGLASGSAFPVGDTQVCYEATDDCSNLETVCFTVTVEEESGGGSGNCNTITFTAGQGSLTVGNLDAPVIAIQVFDASYAPVASCFGDCTSPDYILTGLPAGLYRIKVDYFDASWMPLCQVNETVDIVNAAIMSQEALVFSAYQEGTSAKLKWVAQNSAAINDFVVERSSDATTFEAISKSHTPQSAESIQYFQDIDMQPMAGANYYRLRQTMLDGTVQYSNVERLDFADFNSISVFPNPSSERVFVNLQLLDGQEVSLRLQSLRGQLQKEETLTASNQPHAMELGDLESGMYFLQVESEGQRVQTLKVMVIKK